MRVSDVIKPVRGVHAPYFLCVPEVKDKVRRESHRRCYLPVGEDACWWILYGRADGNARPRSRPDDPLFAATTTLGATTELRRSHSASSSGSCGG